ncbi:MAG: Gfo/Idh/MocA family protein [Thiolinea sp.]
MKKLNIAVVGAGLIGKDHIALVANNPECHLFAIADPTDAGRTHAENHQTSWYTGLDEVLATGQVDGVILATPNQLHVEQTLQCIAAGVPTLIEKPVAHTLDEGRRLLAIAANSDVPLLVGHHRMHSPIMAQARAVIDSGVLGDLVAITGSALFYKPDDYFRAGVWRTQPGGGPILLNMTHEIGNLRYLCGDVQAVQAIASNRRRGYVVEDTVGIVLSFESGVIGTFILSDTAGSACSWEQTSQENPDYTTYPDEDCYHIAGTDGSLSVPTMRIKRYTDKADRSWYKPFTSECVSLERKDPVGEQLKHFCQLIRGEAEPLVSVRDGFQNVLITEAIVEAAASGKTVTIN